MRELIIAVLKTGFGSVGQLLFGIVTTKILAVTIGPSGIGLFSLLKQTLQSAILAGSLNGQNAVVQGLSSRDVDERRDYLVTTFWLILLAGVAGSVLLVILAPQVASLIFHDTGAATVRLLRWMALPMFLGVLFTFISGLMNAERALGRLALVQVINAAITCGLAWPVSCMVRAGYVISFIWMLTVAQAITLVWALMASYRSGWLAAIIHRGAGKLEQNACCHFLRLAIATLVTGLLTSGAALLVRSFVVQSSGYRGAGVFDVAWTISMIYVTLVLTSFTTYYLPTLSATRTVEARVELISRVMRFAIATMVPLVCGVIVLRPLVVRMLYSHEFMPALNTMRWMMLGDYFKVTSFVLSMTVIAFPRMKIYIWTELGWSVGFLAISRMGINGMGHIEAVGIAFLIMYAVYFFVFVYIAAAEHRYNFFRTDLPRWLAGLCFLGAVSAVHWQVTRIVWPVAIVSVSVSIALAWLTLNQEERSIILGAVGSRARRFWSPQNA